MGAASGQQTTSTVADHSSSHQPQLQYVTIDHSRRHRKPALTSFVCSARGRCVCSARGRCLQCQRDTCAVKHQGYVRSARGICVLGPPLCLALSVPLANRLRIFEEFFVFQQVCVCVCLATALVSRGCLRAATRPRHAPQSSRPIGCHSAAGVNWMGASTARLLICRGEAERESA